MMTHALFKVSVMKLLYNSLCHSQFTHGLTDSPRHTTFLNNIKINKDKYFKPGTFDLPVI